jgi:predicted DCC family thiol-disulfide oxidoreductase YuxK
VGEQSPRGAFRWVLFYQLERHAGRQVLDPEFLFDSLNDAHCTPVLFLRGLFLNRVPSGPTDGNIGGGASPVLVYDSTCGFCTRSVQFVLRHERRHDLLFVARDSGLGKELRRAYGLESVESMVWLESGQAFVESRTAMKAADYLGGVWSFLATLASVCPSVVSNAVYRVIAKNRRRLSTQCPIPSLAQRARFLQ